MHLSLSVLCSACTELRYWTLKGEKKDADTPKKDADRAKKDADIHAQTQV